MHSFEIKDTFYLDGEPFKVLSGAFHYFRTVPEYWRDRLEKLKAMGLNTVESYIPWNMHEPQKGRFDFSGMLDVVSFIKLAEELGLYVIIRPSPYICAEWEFGGLPAWLLKEDGMKLRVSYEPFIRHIREYYNVLLPLLKPLLITNGGPIILMQIENEYGYYATDGEYMYTMRDIMVGNGIDVPFITSDGPYRESLNAGRIEGVLATGNFGSRTEERFGILKDYVGGGPLMCAEFWVGWFDHWGNGGHMRGNLEESVSDLDKMIELGHVNIYMFEGGTNFGFMNGSNYYDELTPDVTSYDYDAVLTEDGQITEKYRRYKEVISKYKEIPEVEFTTNIIRRAYGRCEARDKVSLFATLSDISAPVYSRCTTCMEKLGQSYGYILYRSPLKTEEKLEKIKLWRANDRANIYVGGKHIITLYDRELLDEHKLDNRAVNPGDEIDILVENMGRVNFGPYMELQRKGIEHCVQINGHIHNDWQQYCLPLDNIDKVDFNKEYNGGPAFYRFELEVDEKGDTFLDLDGWGKGCVFVNGFNIGRFWEIGPQKRLYIPAPLLYDGTNEIIIFETEGKTCDYVTFMDEPDIG